MDEIEVRSSSGPLLLMPLWVIEAAIDCWKQEPLLAPPPAHVLAVYLQILERDAPHCGVLGGDELGLTIDETYAAMEFLRKIDAVRVGPGDYVGAHIDRPEYRRDV